MSTPDSSLDLHLQAVDIPDGLLQRLRAIPLVDDDGLDAALNDVAAPSGLMAQLQLIPLADDSGLDEALRAVPVPRQFTRTLKRPARRVSRSQRMGQWVMAASLAIGATAAAVAIAISLREPPKSLGGSNVAVDAIPRIGVSPGAEKSGLEKSWASMDVETSGIAPVTAAKDTPAKAGRRLTSAIEIQLAQLEQTTSPDATSNGTANVLADDRSTGALGMPRNFNSLLRPIENSKGQTLGSEWDRLPELAVKATQLTPRGIDWPLVPGAHREFLVMTGFHPFVSPAANARLASCQPPLAADAASYELAQRYLERNEMLPADRVHTEDFLAAAAYDFPKPVGRNVGLSLLGGPSPITDGCVLLQVGVQARDIDSNDHAPEHLIFLVDTSASMRWGSRIEIVRKAMRSLSAWLGKDDRLSLVTFNQGAHVLVEDVQSQNLGIFLEAADSLSAEGSTDVSSGLRVAFTLARQTTAAAHPSARVVLLTDGLFDLDPSSAQQVEGQAADAAAHGISLHVIDLGQQREADPQLAALAKAGHGGAHRATHSEELRVALRDVVTGQSQIMARDARLQVTFNPKAVLEYRLLGHEATEWGGLLPASVLSDLHAGRSATVVYEVRLSPSASPISVSPTSKNSPTTGPPERNPISVASAELLWYEPKKGSERSLERATATIRHSEIAATMSRTAPALQQAAVIAWTAEILRHSPFIFRMQHTSVSAALFHVLELARQVDSRLQQQQGFSEFMSLIAQEIKAHPATRRTAQEK